MATTTSRRWAAVLAAVAVLGGVTACGDGNGDGDGETSDQANSQSTESPEPGDGEGTEGTGAEEGSDSGSAGGTVELSVDVCSLGADAMQGYLVPSDTLGSNDAGEATPEPSEGELGPVCTWEVPAGYGVEIAVGPADEDEPVDIAFADDKVEVPELGEGSAYTETAQQVFWYRGEVSVHVKTLSLSPEDSVTVIAQAIDADLRAAGY